VDDAEAPITLAAYVVVARSTTKEATRTRWAESVRRMALGKREVRAQGPAVASLGMPTRRLVA
jgi:hypothetical protein